MRSASFFLLVLVAVAATWAAEEKYTNKFDNVDIDRILANGRILTNYIRCLMEEGPCTQEGRELKKTLPDALKTGCSKCNEKQKQATEKVIRHLMTNRKSDWDNLSKKYDPQGEYKKNYESLLSKAAKA
ncbi:ejaculatory bulb-specific protein 3 [Anabrus simplex]|uniref:ejaculatory bulb-specific protein 3 n=1 Tax=Anabrus simplex TaxID=316456 RepID=UPI0034DCF2FA